MKLSNIKSALTALATFSLLATGFSAPAQAAGETIELVKSGSTLDGSTIAGFDPVVTLKLTLFTDSGTLTWDNQGSGANLISSNGNTAASLRLAGTQDQLTASLQEITINLPCDGDFKVYAQVTDTDFLKHPTTNHLYKYDTSGKTIDEAIAQAAATPLVNGGTDTFGYVVTITDNLENLVANSFGSGWIGASDRETEGNWKWITGPEAGTLFYVGRGDQGGSKVGTNYSSWGGGEPNDYGDGEDYAEIYGDGRWNDSGDGGRYYITEWGGMQGDNLNSVSIPTDSVDFSVAGPFVGNGTQADPFQVSSAEALRAVATCNEDKAYFKQTVDIELPSNWAGDQDFRGQYNGNNKKISFPDGFAVPSNNFGVWRNSQSGSTIENLKVHGNIDATGFSTVGLLVGVGYAKLSNIKATGSIVAGGDRSSFGGVTGEYGGDMVNVDSEVSITSTTSVYNVGGVSGYYWGSATDVHWNSTMNLSSTNQISQVGGLFGNTDCARVDSSSATGSITVNAVGEEIGGLIGYSCWRVEDSFADVDVTAPLSDRVGGLVGRADGEFVRVTAFGDVSGEDVVGGLFGIAQWNNASDLSAFGNVTSIMRGGSLVGTLENNTIDRAFATGAVTAATSRGLFGEMSGTLNQSHWVPSQSTVTEPSPLENGEVPYSLTDAKDFNYYSAEGWSISTNWDDASTWTICSAFNGGYPFITGHYKEDPCAADQALKPTPTVTGTGIEGAQLTGNPGAWDSGTTLTFAWLVDGEVISNQAGNTYTPVAGDVGKTITFRVTSSKALFKTVVKSSAGIVITAKPDVVIVEPTKRPTTKLEVTVGGFAGNSWWIPKGFVAAIKSAVKAHSKATTVTCVGIVSAGGSKSWQKTLGLKRATLACAVAKSFNAKLKTKVTFKVANAKDKVQRGATLTFNK